MKFHQHQIQAVIFDMDGTLIDTERLRFKLLKQTSLTLFGFEFSDEYLTACLGLNEQSTHRVTQEFYGENFPYWEMRHHARELEHQYVMEHGIDLKTGVLATLEFLKKNNIAMAVATSSERKHAIYYLQRSNIYQYFDALVCGDEVIQGKPHPEIFIKASQVLNCTAQQCLMVEDSENGITSAKHAAGISVLIQDIKIPNEKMLAMADHYYDSLDVLHQTLLTWN